MVHGLDRHGESHGGVRVATAAGGHQLVGGGEVLGLGARLLEQGRDRLVAAARGEQPGAAPVAAAGVDVGAVVEQQPHDLGRLPAPRGHVQRGLLLAAAAHIRVGAVVEQPAQAAADLLLARDVPVAQQEVQRRVAPVAGQVEVHAVLEQQLERLHVVALGGVEGGLAVVGARARLEQQPRDPRRVAVPGDGVEDRELVLAAAGVGIGARLQQRTDLGLQRVVVQLLGEAGVKQRVVEIAQAAEVTSAAASRSMDARAVDHIKPLLLA